MLVDPKNRKFKRFSVNDELAGCKIIIVCNEEFTAVEQLYRIQHLCCDSKRLINHRELVHRHSSGIQFCQYCGSRHLRNQQRVKHSEETKEKALHLRQEGLSYAKIGQALSVSKHTVREWL